MAALHSCVLCQSTFEIGILVLLSGLKKYFLLTTALVIGLVCAIGVNQEKPVEQPVEEGETQRVYAAAIDMDAGEKFDFTKLRVLEVGTERLFDQEPVLELEQIKGQYAATRLQVGDPITSSVVQATDQVPIEKIMPGFSTVTVNSHLDPLLIGLMESGCSVDVAGVIPAEASGKLGVTRLASNCQVLGVQDSTAVEELEAAVTLLVKSELVDPILVAGKAGDLHLSLTGAADEGDFPSGMITTLDSIQQKILAQVALQETPQVPATESAAVTEPIEPMPTVQSEDRTLNSQQQIQEIAAEVAQQVSSQVSQEVSDQVTDQVVQRITDRMDQLKTNQSDVTPAAIVTQTPAKVENYREMEVVTPDGVVRYVWKTRDSEPVIIADEKQETKTSQVLDDDPARIALKK